MNQREKQNNHYSFRFKRFTKKSHSVFSSIGKVVTIGVLSGTALVAAHAQAQAPVENSFFQSKQDSITEKELDEVVVTSSKTALPLNLSAKLVTVISAGEIERAAAQSIEDLLSHFSGVDIQQRGPHGVQSDVSLRGGSFDQTAILLNGVNLTNPQTGHYSFDIPINLSDIERIEIVQGPTSLAYGAGAFSGGINIITKKENKDNFQAKLEGGMHALFGAEVRGSVKTGAIRHQLSGGYRHSDGYMANSDYNISNLLLQSRYKPGSSHIDFTFGLNDKKYGANTFYSASFPDQFDKTRSLFTSIKAETSGKLKVIPQIYWNRHFDEFQLIRNDPSKVPYNHHQSDVFGANINLQYASRWGITGFGGEFRNESIMSSVLGKPMDKTIGKYTHSDSRNNISSFLEHNFIYDNITFSLGGLLNYNRAVSKNAVFYPAINTSYRVNSLLSIYGSWNKATRIPTFTDLFYTTATHIGNSNLEAELSKAYEVGMKFKNRSAEGYFTAFLMKGKNIIDWVKEQPDDLWKSANHTAINKKGFEAGTTINLKRVLGKEQPFNDLKIGYMFLDQKIVESELISNYALNHLRHKITASLYHNITENLSMTWNFRWQDRAGHYILYSDLKPGERTAYKPYSILDFKANYCISKINLFVSVNNLFNTTYFDLGNLPQPGFWMMGGVSWGI